MLRTIVIGLLGGGYELMSVGKIAFATTTFTLFNLQFPWQLTRRDGYELLNAVMKISYPPRL